MWPIYTESQAISALIDSLQPSLIFPKPRAVLTMIVRGHNVVGFAHFQVLVTLSATSTSQKGKSMK